MRIYPRMLYRQRNDFIVVGDENEEIEAGEDGYESHWNPDINELQKGTDKEVLKRAVEETPKEVAPKAEVKPVPKRKTVKKRKVRPKAEVSDK